MERRDFLRLMGVAGGAGASVALGWGLGAPTWLEKAVSVERPRLINLSEVAPHSILVGIAPDQDSIGEIAKNEQQLGVSASVINYFMSGLDINHENVAAFANQISETRRIPMFSWSPFVSDDLESPAFVSCVEKLAGALGSQTGEVWLRFYYEMNGSWMKQMSPDKFKKIWRDLRARTRQYDNIKLIFCPNYKSIYIKSFQNFYPGNEYVDYVALDIYDMSSSNIFDVNHAIPALTPEELIGPNVALMQKLTHEEVPFIVTEFGVWRDNQESQEWIAQAIPYLVRCNAKMIGLFCWNKSGGGIGEKDWRLKEGDNLNAYRAEFQKEYFVTRIRT